MAKLKKSTAKKLTKAVKGGKPSIPLGSALGKVKGLIGIGKAKAGIGARGFRRKHRRSAMWYAKDIARMKLKRRWEKQRMRL